MGSLLASTVVVTSGGFEIPLNVPSGDVGNGNGKLITYDWITTLLLVYMKTCDQELVKSTSLALDIHNMVQNVSMLASKNHSRKIHVMELLSYNRGLNQNVSMFQCLLS